MLTSLRPIDAYICVGNLTIDVSDNGLSPRRHRAIIWTTAEILLIWPLRTNLSEIWENFIWNSNIFIEENLFKNVVCDMLSIPSQPQCINSLNPDKIVHLTEDIFIDICSDEKCRIGIINLLKFISKGSNVIYANNSASV